MSLVNLLFVGIPGAGKGTQARLLTPYGFEHISTGEIIRKAFQTRESLVMPYQEKYNAGEFLPDYVIFQLLEREIGQRNPLRGYILDGAIRNIPQAEWVLEKGIVDKMIFFYLNPGEAMRRLRERGKKGERPDDTEEAIGKRMEIYESETAPMISYLAEKIGSHIVSAKPPIDYVHDEIKRIIGLG